MKLSKLIEQNKTVHLWDTTTEVQDLQKKINSIMTTVANLEIEPNGIMDGMLSDLGKVTNNASVILNLLSNNINEIQIKYNEICVKEAKPAFLESYQRYEANRGFTNLKKVTEYREKFDLFEYQLDEEKFNNIIIRHTSWQYPTVWIRPSKLRFFNTLKASDPLYVLDEAPVLDYIKEFLSPEEINHIRFKIINEERDHPLGELLPAHQIGLFVVDHFFNFKPIEVIKDYLLEMDELLRPGGHILFTFNDCDLPSGVRNFEHTLYSFTPGQIIKDMCTMLGYTIDSSLSTDRVSWICISKAGCLFSNRGGKTLGEIKQKITQNT